MVVQYASSGNGEVRARVALAAPWMVAFLTEAHLARFTLLTRFCLLAAMVRVVASPRTLLSLAGDGFRRKSALSRASLTRVAHRGLLSPASLYPIVHDCDIGLTTSVNDFNFHISRRSLDIQANFF